MYQNVIVIDDSAVERFLSERIIKNVGFAGNVTCFSSASDALNHLQSLGEEQFPDVIFVDIQMPVMTGFDFLDKYMQFDDGVRQHCKIIMLSATLVDEDHARIKKYPVFSKFLMKPLNEEMFDGLVL